MSGGQKQRTAIARALVKNPQIILTDEPTGALDSLAGKEILRILKAISEDRLVIVVSHALDYAEEFADRIIELSDGRIISDRVQTGSSFEKTGEGSRLLINKQDGGDSQQKQRGESYRLPLQTAFGIGLNNINNWSFCGHIYYKWSTLFQILSVLYNSFFWIGIAAVHYAFELAINYSSFNYSNTKNNTKNSH